VVSRPGGSCASDVLKCDEFSHPSDARHRRWHQRAFYPGDSQQPQRGLIGISLKEGARCVNGVPVAMDCGISFFFGFVVAIRIYCYGSNVIFLAQPETTRGGRVLLAGSPQQSCLCDFQLSRAIAHSGYQAVICGLLLRVF